MSEMIHNLPPTPSFRDERPDSPISEIAVRVVVECPGWNFHVVGTATSISGHLAITAQHVMQYVMRTFGAKAGSPTHAIIDGYELKLYQVLPGPIYRMWKVYTAWSTSTDIAILNVGLDGSTIQNEKISWKSPRLRVMPPPIG
jgi:hypothetical protein